MLMWNYGYFGFNMSCCSIEEISWDFHLRLMVKSKETNLKQRKVCAPHSDIGLPGSLERKQTLSGDIFRPHPQLLYSE
jgi:hypothetical protein